MSESRMRETGVGVAAAAEVKPDVDDSLKHFLLLLRRSNNKNQFLTSASGQQTRPDFLTKINGS